MDLVKKPGTYLANVAIMLQQSFMPTEQATTEMYVIYIFQISSDPTDLEWLYIAATNAKYDKFHVADQSEPKL